MGVSFTRCCLHVGKVPVVFGRSTCNNITGIILIMTRIIVKNLPDSVTSDKLKEKFGIKGQITDVQLKYADDGKFRHLGFIGFKTAEEADVALNYFHNTYVGSCKIQVCTDITF